MRIKFLKDHTHETSKWKKGDIANVLRSFALQWVAQGIAELVGGCGCGE